MLYWSLNLYFILNTIPQTALTIIPIGRDCKDWYDNGITTGGVYTVNPDGGTPFTVSY